MKCDGVILMKFASHKQENKPTTWAQTDRSHVNRPCPCERTGDEADDRKEHLAHRAYRTGLEHDTPFLVI